MAEAYAKGNKLYHPRFSQNVKQRNEPNPKIVLSAMIA